VKSGPSALEKILSTDPGQEIILRNLDVTDYASLKRTNFSLSQFFNKRPLSFWMPKLAYYLAQAPHDNWVQFILKSNPNLLQVVFEKVVLKSCTVFNVTPFQLAYSGKDGEMCKTLFPFFEKKYGSDARDEMQKQISEMKNYHQPFDFTPIIQAISNELFNHGRDGETNTWILSKATLTAIETFRKDFDASQPKIIEKGMQFRWETLQELTDAYAEVAKQWRYDYKKCALLEDAVLAWVLGYLPENGKQHCNQGLFYLQKDNPEPLNRMQNTRDGRCFDESLKRRSADFLLDGTCIDVIGRAGGGEACCGWWAFAKLLSNKNFKLAELMQQRSRTKTSACIIL